MTGPAAGQRLRCSTCGTEIIVVKAPSGPISCCGAELAGRDAASTKEGAGDGQHAG